MSKQHIAHVSLLVKDYDEAIQFYTNQLGFKLVEDTWLDENKRWVIVEPPGQSQCKLLLAKAATEMQSASVGNQAGGRVFLFLYTDDFWSDYQAMQKRGVVFVRLPQVQAYGIVAVFQDLYGNLWDLLQPDVVINA